MIQPATETATAGDAPAALRNVLLVIGGPRSREELGDPLEAAGLQVHAIHGRQYDIIPRALLALPSLRRRRFDIIMTHTWTGHAAAARLLGSALDLPVVLRLRGDTWSATEDLVRLYDTLPRRIGMWCRMTLGSRNVRDLDCVMPVAHWMTRLGEERVPDSRALWLPVHYPVREMPPPPEDTGRLLRRWSPEGRPIVASVTNFGYWNKINPMLEAAPAMAEFLERHGMLWVIAGTGAMYEDSFFERLADLCPPHLWHRAGFMSEPWLLYYSAWAFLHLSNEEGLPAVVMEAQSCGCPVVTNRHPGMSELVQHERTGLSVEEPGDAAGMLERLAGEEGLRESLRERAREWISTTHSREAVGRQMAEVLARVRAHYHETGRGSDRSGGRR